MNPFDKLRHHVTGAIERGEAEPVTGIPAVPETDNQLEQAYLDWFNNYQELEIFASHLGVSTDEAFTVIAKGRRIHLNKNRNHES